MKDFFQKNIGLIIGVLGGLASLIVILQFLVSPIYNRLNHIENQVNNHIPTQIRRLEQKIDQTNQRLGEKIDQTNQRLGQKIDQINQGFGEKIDQTNQRLDQTNQRLDRLFEMLAKNQQEK